MTIHERIKARRKECGLSADEVAAELGVSRATVYRYESAEIANMGIDKIEPLARVLHTSPAYLMGWTDDPIDYEDDALLEDIRLDLLHEWQEEGLTQAQMARRWLTVQRVEHDDALREQAQMSSTLQIENPDIRMIARAGKKMTPEQAENLRKYAQFMYPEAFEDDK